MKQPSTRAAAKEQPEQLELELPLSDKYHVRMHAERLLDACRDVAERQGYKQTADELDQIFGDLGHPVSASLLSNALNDRERNYWRGEWIPYFARRSPLVASIVAESTKTPLTAEQKLDLLEQMGTEEFGPAFKRLLAKVGRR